MGFQLRIDNADRPQSNTDVSVLSWRAAIQRLDGAYSEHTLRSYRSDFTIFERWCLGNDRAPLPATPQVVADFVAGDAVTSGSSTLKRRLAVYFLRIKHGLGVRCGTRLAISVFAAVR